MESKAKKGRWTLRSVNIVKVVYGGPTARPILDGAGHKAKPCLTMKQALCLSQWVWVGCGAGYLPLQ